MPWLQPGVEHIGHQHGVVERVDLDAAPGKNLPVVFHVLADLEDAGVFQHLLDDLQRFVFRNLIGTELGLRREQIVPPCPPPSLWPMGT